MTTHVPFLLLLRKMEKIRDKAHHQIEARSFKSVSPTQRLSGGNALRRTTVGASAPARSERRWCRKDSSQTVDRGSKCCSKTCEPVRLLGSGSTWFICCLVASRTLKRAKPHLVHLLLGLLGGQSMHLLPLPPVPAFEALSYLSRRIESPPPASPAGLEKAKAD